jgi:hypothetical protein
MPPTMSAFSIRPVVVRSGAYRYDRFQIAGSINGRRIRATAPIGNKPLQFKTGSL